MIEFVLAFVFFVFVVLAMSIGTLYGRKPISGSCGGLNNVGVDGACEICGGTPQACQKEEITTPGSKN